MYIYICVLRDNNGYDNHKINTNTNIKNNNSSNTNNGNNNDGSILLVCVQAYLYAQYMKIYIYI